MLRHKETRVLWVCIGLVVLIAIGVGIDDTYRLVKHLPFGGDIPFAPSIAIATEAVLFGFIANYMYRHPNADPNR